MKRTRNYLIAVCALAIGFATPLIHAEEGAPPPPKKQGPGGGGPLERILKLKETLGLTETQVAQIKKIGEDQRAALKALRDKEGDRESKKGEMKKIQDDTKARLDAVLTAEQKAKLEEIRKSQGPGPDGEKGPKEGKGPKGPAPDSEM